MTAEATVVMRTIPAIQPGYVVERGRSTAVVVAAIVAVAIGMNWDKIPNGDDMPGIFGAGSHHAQSNRSDGEPDKTADNGKDSGDNQADQANPPNYPCVKWATPAKRAKIAAAIGDIADGIHWAPGAAVTVTCGDEIIASVGRGHTRSGKGTPDPAKTTFDVKSNTKPLTGLTGLMLEDDGKLDMDDPASKYFPEFSNAYIQKHHRGDRRYAKKPQVTIRQLYSHNAGIVDPGTYNGAIGGAHNEKQLTHRFADAPLGYTPGKGNSYSNESSFLAGEVNEIAAGMPVEKYQKKELFVPLGLPHEGYSADSSDCAEPGCGTDDRIANTAGGISGQAGWRPTSNGMAKVFSVYAMDGTINGHRYIAPGAAKEAFTHTPNSTYGLGIRTNVSCYFGCAISKSESGGHYGDATSEWNLDLKSGVGLFRLTNRPFRGQSDGPPKAIQKKMNATIMQILESK